MATPIPTKTRAKKTAAKNPNQKRPPQRGLGVAQLERLRLQERWKKMTEMPPPPHHFQSHSPFLLDPTLGNFPLHFPGGAPAVVGNDCASGVLGFDQQGFVVQRIGNGGFIGGGGGLMPVEAYPHGGSAVDPRLLIGNNGVEASRELSSIPKLPPRPCVSDRCDICVKKNRVNDFNNMAKDKNTIATAETASFDFLGLSTNSAAELSSAAVNQFTDFGPTFNLNQGGAEIKQIHRRAAENGGGGEGSSILMEYEFFPGKNGRGTEFEELEMPKGELEMGTFAEEGVLMDHGEGSCITTSCTDIINGGTSSSSAIDLSLKLSF